MCIVGVGDVQVAIRCGDIERGVLCCIYYHCLLASGITADGIRDDG